MKLQSINPSNYKLLGEVETSSEQEIKDKVSLAHKAFETWSRMALKERVSLIGKVFEEFDRRKEEFALLEAKEMGMPLSEALIDYEGSLHYAQWYLENAEKYLTPETTFEDEKEIHQVYYEPMGVVASIIAWNFPFGNLVWNTTQSLLAGNTLVLKHSEECFMSGKLIEEIFTKNLPIGVFNEVYGAGDVGTMLSNLDINMITFIGSTNVGKKLYELAGKKFIRAMVEMGGSAPGVVFADADIDSAIESITFNRLLNTGQACDGLKRLIVHESIFDQVVEKLKVNFESKKIGNAEDSSTLIGPLVAKRQLDVLVSQVNDSVAQGAKIVTGGKSLEIELGGAYFQPTILTNITKDMRVWREEVFGPVLPVFKFSTDEEAIALANDTQYGLGGYVYTKDLTKAAKIASEIKTGMVSINSTNYVMPFNPFGGYKDSGMGREHGKFGFAEVTQVKVVSKNK